jgi:hypothetical protein
MYSEGELDAAVAAGVLDAETAQRFRTFVAAARSAPAVDEEYFRLITGFNDIFVSIATILLLIAVHALVGMIAPGFGGAAVAVASWPLAEFFTRKRRMALPSILLLFSFVGGIFSMGMVLTAMVFAKGADAENLFAVGVPIAAGVLAGLAAYAHWRRFRVPITVAVGTAILVATVVATIVTFVPGLSDWAWPILLLCGLAVFALAMAWDMSDRERRTRRSDIAFWLHLSAAPMIVHPIFAMLGVLQADGADRGRAVAALAIYLVLAMVALAIDRRALLVSALFYVLYAMGSLFTAAGSVDASFGLTGLVIGAGLLLLSAFWHPTRRLVLGLLPPRLQARLPAIGG